MKSIYKFLLAGLFAVAPLNAFAADDARRYDGAIDALAAEVRALAYDYQRQQIGADDLAAEIAVLTTSLDQLLAAITTDNALQQAYLKDCNSWFEQLQNVLDKLEEARTAA